jgi:hypothetical protein
MARSSFGCKFDDLTYFELDFFFHIPWIHYYTLKGIFLYFFWELLAQYHHLYTHLHHLLEHVDFFKIVWLHRSIGFKIVYVVFFHRMQSLYIVLNHFHLNMCKDQELSTLPYLHPINEQNHAIDSKLLMMLMFQLCFPTEPHSFTPNSNFQTLATSPMHTTTLFMVFSVTYPILRRMLGYTNDQQLHHQCHLTTLGIQVRLLNVLGMSTFNNVMRCMPILHNDPQVD